MDISVSRDLNLGYLHMCVRGMSGQSWYVYFEVTPQMHTYSVSLKTSFYSHPLTDSRSSIHLSIHLLLLMQFRVCHSPDSWLCFMHVCHAELTPLTCLHQHGGVQKKKKKEEEEHYWSTYSSIYSAVCRHLSVLCTCGLWMFFKLLRVSSGLSKHGLVLIRQNWQAPVTHAGGKVASGPNLGKVTPCILTLMMRFHWNDLLRVLSPNLIQNNSWSDDVNISKL